MSRNYGARQRDYEMATNKAARLRADCDRALEGGFGGLSLDSGKGTPYSELAALLAACRAVLASPEGHGLLVAEVDRVERESRDAAVEEGAFPAPWRTAWRPPAGWSTTCAASGPFAR